MQLHFILINVSFLFLLFFLSCDFIRNLERAYSLQISRYETIGGLVMLKRIFRDKSVDSTLRTKQNKRDCHSHMFQSRDNLHKQKPKQSSTS